MSETLMGLSRFFLFYDGTPPPVPLLLTHLLKILFIWLRDLIGLLQGRDDARQDAVMQQVFLLVNELFRAEQSTQSMNIRTYQVIPLSQRSGLLEWCEGTTPVGKTVDPLFVEFEKKYGGCSNGELWMVQLLRHLLPSHSDRYSVRTVI